MKTKHTTTYWIGLPNSFNNRTRLYLSNQDKAPVKVHLTPTFPNPNPKG